MKVEITVNVSDFFCKIYEFEATYDFIEYTGYSESRRNSTSSPWGHEWTDFYADRISALNKKFEALIDETDNDCDADMVRMEWRKASEEFFPTCHKADDGKPFYGGHFGPSKWLPTLPWTEEEVEKLVVDEMSKKLKKTKKTVRIK